MACNGKDELELMRLAPSSEEENVTVLDPCTASNEQRQDSKPLLEKQDKKEEQDLIMSDMMRKRHPLLRHAYRNDQWSPLNQDGNRIYDRDFFIELLNDPKSNIKPLNLPDVAIILNMSRNLVPMDMPQLEEVYQLGKPGCITPNVSSETTEKNQDTENSIDIESMKENEIEEPDQSNTSPKGCLLLNYTYATDQWSPVNTNGKKVYDGEFLKKLQSDPNSKMRPLNLPNVDVVLKDKSNQSISKKKKRKNKKLAISDESSSIKENIELRQTENAWQPLRLRVGNASNEDNTTEALYKKVQGALNKLMPENLDILVKELKLLKIDSQEKLQGVVDMIYERAVNEPKLMVVYALMCKKLAPLRISNPESEANKKDNGDNFGKLIITRCVMELETAIHSRAEAIQKREIEGTPDLANELGQTLAKQDTIIRIKSFGNIRFIGELSKQEMVKACSVHKCIRYLLTQIEDDSLECLSKLLITAGKDFESKNQKLEPYFQQMLDIVHGKIPGKVSSRVRFILQDVIELRNNNWIPRMDYSSNEMVDEIEIESDIKRLCIHMYKQHHFSELNINLGISERMNDKIEEFLDPCVLKTIVKSILSASTSTSSKPTLIMSEEELAKKSASILEKYLFNTNISNAALEVHKTFDNSTLAHFVREMLNGVVEKSATARKQVSQLMTHLISRNILPLSLYLAGLAEVLEMAEDLVIDIPKIWVYLAELIWCPLAEGVHPMSELQTVISSITSIDRVGELISSIALISLLEKKNLQWDDFSKKNECFDDLIKNTVRSHSVDDLQSSNENVPQNTTSVAEEIVKPKKLTTSKYISSKQDEQDESSTSVISEPNSSDSRDYATPNEGQPRASTPPVKKPQSSMTKKNLTKKSALILENYLSGASIETAAVQVCETFDNSTFPNFVRESLSKVVNKSKTNRKQVSQLMAHLISENILPLSLYLSSLREVLDGTGNVVIDFTRIWVYLAELIWYPLAEGVHPFSELKKLMAPLKNKGLAGALMGELMTVLLQEKSPEWIKDEWDRSGLELNDFLQENESLNDFIQQYKLEFLFRDRQQLTMAQIHDHLFRLMSNKKTSSFDNICSWISTNVGMRANNPEFIKVLMTTILRVSIEPCNNSWQFKKDKFQKLQALIPYYIDATINLTEIQCLISIQEYIHQLKHPQCVLLELLEKQIFESILSFDVFHVWESSEDLKPLSNKSAAMLALKLFFTAIKKKK